MNILCKFVRKAVIADKLSLPKRQNVRLKGKHFHHTLRNLYFQSKPKFVSNVLLKFLEQHMVLDLVVLAIFKHADAIWVREQHPLFLQCSLKNPDSVTHFQLCSQVEAPLCTLLFVLWYFFIFRMQDIFYFLSVTTFENSGQLRVVTISCFAACYDLKLTTFSSMLVTNMNNFYTVEVST